MARRFALFTLLLVACGGCVSGSLATTTGARPGETWSAAREQPAHVGETVTFSFILRRPLSNDSIHALGLADYCIFDIGGDRYDVPVDESGAFQTELTLSRFAPGDRVRVRAAAYRQYDDPDGMRVGDEWVRSESPMNLPDEHVASADLTLRVYQSTLEMSLPPIPAGLDSETARLTLYRRDGAESVIFLEHPPRHGFVIRPAGVGGYRLTYAPSGDQVNPTGTTRAVFTVLDTTGLQHELTTDFATP